MTGMANVPADVTTVHLGGFTAPHAARIAQRLDAAGIVWWSKEPGFISQLWQHGVEMFVDKAKLGEARTVAAGVLGKDG
jgi:hypothetical protein